MKILLVEDDPTDVKLATVVLESDGHRVVATGTPAEVLQSVLEHRPDVILLDLALPGTNGTELGRQLKANPDSAAIPLVAVTAFPTVFPESMVIEAGFDACLVKPIMTRTFTQSIADVVHHHRSKPSPSQPKQPE